MKKLLFIFSAMLLLTACQKTTTDENQPSATPQPETSADPEASLEDTIEYKNTDYGFIFTLPSSWKDYTIVTEEWEGASFDASQGEQEKIEKGPLILIRHPLWTQAVPRQDVPIMVFTLGQWDSMQKDEFHIGAAPINPTELARNVKYVFALPARYNYAFPEGFEEVEKILQSKPITTF